MRPTAKKPNPVEFDGCSITPVLNAYEKPLPSKTVRLNIKIFQGIAPANANFQAPRWAFPGVWVRSVI